MRKKFIKKYIVSIIILSLSLSACGFQNESEKISKNGFYFDTIISVTLFGSRNQDALEKCFKLADKYEDLFSDTVSGSDVSRINSSGGEPVSVQPETSRLIKSGIRYGKLSGGKFDISIGKLSKLWNLSDPENASIPDEASLKRELKSVDYSQVSVKDNVVTLARPEAALDLGGIAKGYIADRMREYLESEGVTSGIINLGGNVVTIGSKPDGKPFTVGIQKPFSDDGTPICTVQAENKSVVTSGTYQRYIKVHGRIYHHILDTNSGYPIQNELNSVTIIGDSSEEGDALSTTCFALGLEKGLDFIESLEGTEAIFITKDDKLHFTSGMGQSVRYSVKSGSP